MFVHISRSRIAKHTLLQAIDDIVTSLFCVLVSNGQVPIIRASRGHAAEMIAGKLDKKLRDHLKMSRTQLFREGESYRPWFCSVDAGLLSQNAYATCDVSFWEPTLSLTRSFTRQFTHSLTHELSQSHTQSTSLTCSRVTISFLISTHLFADNRTASLVTTTGMSAMGSFQRPLLALIDRHVDLTTMLHHTCTYQALTHDVLEYKLNRVAYVVSSR